MSVIAIYYNMEYKQRYISKFYSNCLWTKPLGVSGEHTASLYISKPSE